MGFRTTCARGIFVISSCLLSLGAANPQATTPTFHSSTELVTVPVVVKDHHGNHVGGLVRNDFHVFEDGHEVEIRGFDRMPGPRAPAVSSVDRAKGQIASPQTLGSAPIILFFDQLNTPANEQAGVRRQLALGYKAQQTLAAPTCVMLYTGSTLRILQFPTTEAAKVRAAIESIQTTVNSGGAGAAGDLALPAGANENFPNWDGDGPLRTLGRLAYFRIRESTAGDTQSALIYAARMFAAWPGEKALIWISAGTTVKVRTTPLQEAQVKLYALNVHVLINYGSIATFTRPDTTSEYETAVNRQLLMNMGEAVQETGGEVCSNSLAPESCVQKALDDTTEHYLLSYETHSRSPHPEWRQIRVKVDRPGVRVSARHGVMIPPNLGNGEKKRQQIAEALASPVDLPGLRLELQPLPPRHPGQELTVSLVLRSDANVPGVWNSTGMDFTVAGVVLCGSVVVQWFGEDVHGPLAEATISKLNSSGLGWTHKIVAPHDPALVRLVVRDNATSRIGSITQSLP